MTNRKPFILLVLFIASASAFKNYCKFSREHTLCKYAVNRVDEENCGTVLDRTVSQESQLRILAEHNKYRKEIADGKHGQPKAANMKEMEWDDELATIAQTLADQCVVKATCDHCVKVDRFDVGQNVFSEHSKEENYRPDWSQAIQNWFDPVKTFEASSIMKFRSEDSTASYAQLAWAETSKVGCGYVAVAEGEKTKGIYVCHYGPKGNVEGAQMYSIGNPCYACPSSTSCSFLYPGLCKESESSKRSGVHPEVVRPERDIEEDLVMPMGEKDSTGLDQDTTDKDQYTRATNQDTSDKDQSPSDTDQNTSDTDQSPTDTDQYPSDTDQSPTDTDQYPSDTDQSPTDTDQYPSDTDQYPSDTDQSPTDTDQYPSDTDQYPSDTDESTTEMPPPSGPGSKPPPSSPGSKPPPSGPGSKPPPSGPGSKPPPSGPGSNPPPSTPAPKPQPVPAPKPPPVPAPKPQPAPAPKPPPAPAPSSCTSGNYCDFTKDHTMCKYKQGIVNAAKCGKPIKRLISQEERKLIVSEHNKLRLRVAKGEEKLSKGSKSQPEAANMREMVWDEELAKIAQTLADQCIGKHDCNECRKVKRFGTGQNIYSGSVWNQALKVEWPKAVQSWYDEVKDFSASSINPFKFTSATGHYTQVVWASSWRVGCGFIAFNKEGGWKTGLYICNYGPGGNMKDGEMYKTGTKCSKCPKDTKCSTQYDGLCATTSKVACDGSGFK